MWPASEIPKCGPGGMIAPSTAIEEQSGVSLFACCMLYIVSQTALSCRVTITNELNHPVPMLYQSIMSQ